MDSLTVSASPPLRTCLLTDIYQQTEPVTLYLMTDSKHPLSTALVASIHMPEPSCFTQASKDPAWRATMTTEFDALLRNGTWDLIPRTLSMNVVRCKWVYKLKHQADGSIKRYKTRLVAKGCHQQPGLDYTDTFSPVIKITTVRLLLCIAICSNWNVRQLDVSNAFLHGSLKETVYMEQLSGFTHPLYPSHVCHLYKSLYGLKQALRAWFNRLGGWLQTQGFSGSKTNTSLFYQCTSTSKIYILIYVDDILVTENNLNEITTVIQSLNREFSV
ncbi:Retrovirus-related Pol polyprotein from transposon TNT 1-94 [Apostasia shenzhenica]|uniref:Retrovirus-related Pol polyprotein from transposon TNT 1-94 n=1 Tax=Apostasia shenzhenica TaxID=1088818 RepID=A0A2I0A1U0_9ASPA|nr:Retrovirus-related Pol polyprotein from transposon TNT 1-94 [Apostasia shenzhenica]